MAIVLLLGFLFILLVVCLCFLSKLWKRTDGTISDGHATVAAVAATCRVEIHHHCAAAEEVADGEIGTM